MRNISDQVPPGVPVSAVVFKAACRTGELCLVTHDAVDWFNDQRMLTSIRLVRLNVLNFPNIPTLGDPVYVNRIFGMDNTIDDEQGDHIHFGWPAVEINKTYDIVAVYARSGDGIYPEARFSAYLDSEPDLRFSRLLRKGDNTYGNPNCIDGNNNPCVYRWGDNAGASVDPYDDTAIWIAQQYANIKGGYDIWVGKVFGKKYPDYSAASIAAPSTIQPGGSFTISGKISNHGDGASEMTRAAVYLIANGDGVSVQIGEFIQPLVEPGATKEFHATLTLPARVPPGRYLLKVLLNSNQLVEEYSTKNNSAFADRIVRVGTTGR